MELFNAMPLATLIFVVYLSKVKRKTCPIILRFMVVVIFSISSSALIGAVRYFELWFRPLGDFTFSLPAENLTANTYKSAKRLAPSRFLHPNHALKILKCAFPQITVGTRKEQTEKLIQLCSLNQLRYLETASINNDYTIALAFSMVEF